MDLNFIVFACRKAKFLIFWKFAIFRYQISLLIAFEAIPKILISSDVIWSTLVKFLVLIMHDTYSPPRLKRAEIDYSFTSRSREEILRRYLVMFNSRLQPLKRLLFRRSLSTIQKIWIVLGRCLFIKPTHRPTLNFSLSCFRFNFFTKLLFLLTSNRISSFYKN